MPNQGQTGAVLLVIFAIAIALVIIYLIFRSPFHYPYWYYEIDISGRREPQYEDYIDRFIIAGRFYSVQKHYESIKAWKEECRIRIDKSVLKNYRNSQFQKCLDDRHAFQFKFTRMQTRYRQVNYIKHAYKVSNVVGTFLCTYEYLLDRKKQLEAINYEMPLRAYFIKNQRKLMTKSLREKIMRRDNYTCQICGKYMPDGVGLQIDHIIPVSKGGKTTESNLQVTCSKCNGHKNNRIQPSYFLQ